MPYVADKRRLAAAPPTNNGPRDTGGDGVRAAAGAGAAAAAASPGAADGDTDSEAADDAGGGVGTQPLGAHTVSLSAFSSGDRRYARARTRARA